MVKLKPIDTEVDDEEERIYCLSHAMKNIQMNRMQAKHCKLVFTYSTEEIETLISKINEKLLQNKKGSKVIAAGSSSTSVSNKKSSSYNQPNKYAGMATMLK